MNKQTEKQQLRKTMHTLEARLPERYLAQADRKIAAQLLAMPEYQAADTVFCFVSTGREIDTHPILQAALVAAFCGCTKEVLGLWSGRRGRCPGRTLGATMTLFE